MIRTPKTRGALLLLSVFAAVGALGAGQPKAGVAIVRSPAWVPGATVREGAIEMLVLMELARLRQEAGSPGLVAVGDRRDKVCCMVNIDFEAVGNWAERRNLPYAGYTDLAQKPEVYQLIKECVEKVNADLAADEKLAGSQIHRFLVLHKELDADDGELTRTNKVRRGFIADKYLVLVDALYGGKTEQYIETQVKFEDGRTGSVSATLKIQDARTFAPVRAAA